MPNRSKPTLHPTLWRTCRVLANTARLRMLAVLFRRGNLTVSEIADKVGVSRIVASQSLRALAARGLLAARRRGRAVHYRPAADPSVRGTGELLRALRSALRRDGEPIDAAFRDTTAFTHPRRIDVVRTLSTRPLPSEALARRTGISPRALRRHMSKLSRRNFVGEKDGVWCLSRPRHVLAAALLRLACGL